MIIVESSSNNKDSIFLKINGLTRLETIINESEDEFISLLSNLIVNQYTNNIDVLDYFKLKDYINKDSFDNISYVLEGSKLDNFLRIHTGSDLRNDLNYKIKETISNLHLKPIDSETLTARVYSFLNRSPESFLENTYDIPVEIFAYDDFDDEKLGSSEIINIGSFLASLNMEQIRELLKEIKSSNKEVFLDDEEVSVLSSNSVFNILNHIKNIHTVKNISNEVRIDSIKRITNQSDSAFTNIRIEEETIINYLKQERPLLYKALSHAMEPSIG